MPIISNDPDMLPEVRNISHMIEFLEFQSEYMMRYARFDMVGDKMYFAALAVRDAIKALRLEYTQTLKFQMELYQ